VKPGKLRVAIGDVAPWLMLCWALLAPASILHYVGVKGLYSTVFVMTAALAFGAVAHRRFRVSTLVVAACVVLFSLGNVVQWSDYRYVFYCLFFFCALVLADMAGKAGIERFCTVATSLMTVLLIGAVISFVLAWLGLPPVFTITNPDGQDYYFFYTGFTNSYNDNLIRASAIYDEPGAFSMYICFVAALRHLLQRERRTTWLILTLGFITFSLAHLIYVMCHFLAEQSSKKRIVFFLSALSVALFALVTTITLDSNVILLSRLALTEDANLFAGDNRSFQLFNAWDQILDHPSSIFFGLDHTCVFSQTVCRDKFGPMGENPLSPLVFGGISSELPYYVALISFLVSPLFGRKYIALFGIGLLFLQRPYVTGFSYALIAVLLLEVSLRRGLNTSATAAPADTLRRASTAEMRSDAVPG
jgi:hypothetical protein